MRPGSIQQASRSTRVAGGAAGLLVAAIALQLGCATPRALLPRERSSDAPFRSYDSADEAFASIVPGRTTASELRSSKLDPAARGGPAVRTYSEAAVRLLPERGGRDAAPPGVRACLEALGRCEVWTFDWQRTRRNRVGNWVLDVLKFRRVRETKGWRFSGTILLVDGVVTFVEHGGVPRVSERTLEVQPLGLLQDVGSR